MITLTDAGRPLKVDLEASSYDEFLSKLYTACDLKPEEKYQVSYKDEDFHEFVQITQNIEPIPKQARILIEPGSSSGKL
jgi:hypothetical protein